MRVLNDAPTCEIPPIDGAILYINFPLLKYIATLYQAVICVQYAAGEISHVVASANFHFSCISQFSLSHYSNDALTCEIPTSNDISFTYI